MFEIEIAEKVFFIHAKVHFATNHSVKHTSILNQELFAHLLRIPCIELLKISIFLRFFLFHNTSLNLNQFFIAKQAHIV